jgi:uncharacterized 2Fe-2S/4Fe-4S cluster protein (DUF4445 family)
MPVPRHDKQRLTVDLQPVGRRIEIEAGKSILEAAQAAGVELVAICGGEGTCGTCLVRLVAGQLSPATSTEQGELSEADLAAGFRLACQAHVLSDVRIEIPPESLSTPQRLQIEGEAVPLELDPLIVPVEVELEPPSLTDLRSDLTRLRQALSELGYPHVQVRLDLLLELSEKLRAGDWKLRLALRGGQEIIAILPSAGRLIGLAVDVGTTKLAAYLVDLESGLTLVKAGGVNPQIAYGEDVISRIQYANTHRDGTGILQKKLVDSLNLLVEELCAEAGCERREILEAVVVGNTAMHHLFAGLPVKQLGEAPYVASVGDPMEFRASQVGLHLAPDAYVYLPPNVAGFVGADHVAMLLGAGLEQVSQTALALDIGTNTEISLFHGGQHLSCSCASGPAFEGAHITDGMRAAAGAIERVRIDSQEVQVHTIGEKPAVGICGSGILDTVAQLLAAGLLDARGVLQGEHSRLRGEGAQTTFILAPDDQSGMGREIKVTRQDINEIQLAKGAIRAGIEILLHEAGIQDQRIQLFVVAGAFGTYLDPKSAMRIGMFPELPLERFRQVGNAAGSGARLLLLSQRMRRVAEELAEDVHYIELANHPDFMNIYMKALTFP